MKNAYLITGIRFRKLHRLLHENKCSFTPRIVFRYMILLQNSFWSSFFARRDQLKFGKEISKFAVPEDPIFIVGHWRTGSTYLHQLMALDEHLSAPTLYQTALPESFITARPYYAPIMKRFIGKNRPFDNIKAGIDEPQECEFALFRMTGDSPMKRLLFPINGKYFLLQDDVQFNPAGERGLRWEAAMTGYYQKLAWFSGKQLLLKNPFHSMRIDLLKRRFPKARFIHIYRNPMEVVPSTIRMWTVVNSQNAMNRRWNALNVEEVTTFYKIMLQELQIQQTRTPDSQWVNIKYEELVADPITTLRNAYQQLNLEFNVTFEHQLTQYIECNRDYKKNRHNMSDQDKESIQNIIMDTLPEYFQIKNVEHQ